MHDGESPVASVDRALRILALVGAAPRGMTLDDLAASLEIPKSSLHRILAALKYRQFVAQPEVGGAYFLGTEMLATAFRFHEMLDVRALIHPLLLRITAELNETTHMAVLDGAEVVYQDKIEAAHTTIKLSSVIGGRNPAHATGVGKALLAWTYPTDQAIRALNETIYGDKCAYWMAGLKYYLVRKGLAATTNHHLHLELPESLRRKEVVQ